MMPWRGPSLGPPPRRREVLAGVGRRAPCGALAMSKTGHSSSLSSSSSIPQLYTVTLYRHSIPSLYTVTLYRHSIPSLYTVALYRHSIPSLCTVTLYRHSVPSLYTVTLYHHSIPSLCTVTLYRHSILSLYTITLYRHSIPSLYTVTLYRHSVPSLYTVTLYRHSIPSLYTVTLYRHSIPQLYTATLYRHSIPSLYTVTLYRHSVGADQSGTDLLVHPVHIASQWRSPLDDRKANRRCCTDWDPPAGTAAPKRAAGRHTAGTGLGARRADPFRMYGTAFRIGAEARPLGWATDTPQFPFLCNVTKSDPPAVNAQSCVVDGFQVPDCVVPQKVQALSGVLEH